LSKIVYGFIIQEDGPYISEELKFLQETPPLVHIPATCTHSLPYHLLAKSKPD
jgi:hypothetical protein